MKNEFILPCIFVLGFLLLGAGCSTTTNTAVDKTNVQQVVETNTVMPTTTTDSQIDTPAVVSKIFESENGDFSYTLDWNSKVLTLASTQYKWSTAHAPSFDIVGGGTVTVATGWIDSPGYQMSTFINDIYYEGDRVWPTTQSGPSEAGTSNPVYYFNQPVEMNKDCLIEYGVVKGLNEALVIRKEDCTGNDMKSSEAFGDLVSDLVIVRH